MEFLSINPATDEVINRYPKISDTETQGILLKTNEAFQMWRTLPFSDRAHCFKRMAQLLLEHKKKYAELISAEMGKIHSQALYEIEKCALGCEYYAENAETFLKPETVQTDAKKSYVAFLPLGIILAIMPWNFPFWQVFRFAAPALMAGNACVLKHASNVFGCALAIETLFKEAGFPENLFRSLTIDVPAVEKLIANPLISAVTITGSVRAGRSVAALCGRALKKCVLELGGSDPFIILEDADLDKALELGMKSRLFNSGQSCIAAKRFILVDAVRDTFTKKLLEKVSQLKCGDPKQTDVEIGPLARHDLREQLHAQIMESTQKGAHLLIGGKIPEGTGAFYPPTILTDVKKGMPAYNEELFGPVFSIISAKNQQEAIAIANDTPYGLGATIITKDSINGEKIAFKEIQAGSCFVNGMVKSDPRLPFGGIKDSGYGRELSHFGIREFVNIKTVWIGN